MERNLFEEILKIINSNLTDEEKSDALADYHENDIAAVVHDLTKEERLKLYAILGDEKVSEIFSYLDDVEDYIDEISQEHAADIIELMDSDDAVDVLDELEEESRQRIIELMNSDAVEDIEMISSYDDAEIASKMTTNFITVNKNNTIKQAMKKIISEAAENDNVATIFAVNDDETFYGSIDLRDIIIARDGDVLEEIIKTSYPVLHAHDLVSECVNKLKEYALDTIPVLDENNIIIGAITSEDIIETVDEQMSEDYAKLGGLSSAEDLDESLFKSVKKRMPWLLSLLVLGMFISMLISSFENVVKTLPMIVFFQSLILDMAGNTGTQSLAVTIRVLTDEQVSNKTLAKMVLKEGKVGLSNGLILSILSFTIVSLFLVITKTEIVIGDGFILSEALKAAGVVAISLVVAMTFSSIIGSLVPIILKKCHVDPAVASGPFITTMNDIIAILIYYGLALILFMNML